MYKTLNKKNWQHVNLQLVCKILREFLYEEMFSTQIINVEGNNHHHRLVISDSLYYEFIAEPRIFGQWHIKETSIKRHPNNEKNSILVSQFIRDTYELIGIDGLTLGHLLRELNNTLIADCHLLEHGNLTSAELLKLPNQELEGFMHGHPWFVINKGRLGFSYNDYLQYAPERRNPISLSWIAVNRARAIFNSITSLNYDVLVKQELSAADRQNFANQLTALNLNIDDYYFMPIHEWQWQEHLISLFAQDIIEHDIVYLGQSADKYLPTQSIRTFSNQSNTANYQVKLPLSIFNTAVYRGLPGDRTQLAPMLSEWLQAKYEADSFLKNNCRLVLLGEIASVDYPHRDYQHLKGVPYQYNELLGVIWRESIAKYLSPGESAITMAALIHVDNQQKPFISVLIEESGLSLQQWLGEFLRVCIPPLLHWLYRYGIVFSPHGENTLLILENSRPKALVLKDFIDDVNISDRKLPETQDLPLALQEVLLEVPDHYITQFIHSGLFVVLYRYLSDILQTYENYNESLFWQEVHTVIEEYQQAHPELQERFKQFDLLSDSFKKLCLNRLRLLEVGYADYDDRPKVESISSMKNPANPQVYKTWKTEKYDVAPV